MNIDDVVQKAETFKVGNDYAPSTVRKFAEKTSPTFIRRVGLESIGDSIISQAETVDTRIPDKETDNFNLSLLYLQDEPDDSLEILFNYNMERNRYRYQGLFQPSLSGESYRAQLKSEAVPAR